MGHLLVVSSDHYRFFHGPCNPELSPEMSQAPGSLLPAPARDQSLFRGRWAQECSGSKAVQNGSGYMRLYVEGETEQQQIYLRKGDHSE